MQENLDKQGAKLPTDKLKQAFAAQLAGLKRLLRQHGSVDTLSVEHPEVVAEPAKIARRIALFLGKEMDEQAVAAMVDPSPHRQKKAPLDKAAWSWARGHLDFNPRGSRIDLPIE